MCQQQRAKNNTLCFYIKNPVSFVMFLLVRFVCYCKRDIAIQFVLINYNINAILYKFKAVRLTIVFSYVKLLCGSIVYQIKYIAEYRITW